MEYIASTNRNQVELHCPESLIKKDNAVRFIEAFVEKLDLVQLPPYYYQIEKFKQ